MSLPPSPEALVASSSPVIISSQASADSVPLEPAPLPHSQVASSPHPTPSPAAAAADGQRTSPRVVTPPDQQQPPGSQAADAPTAPKKTPLSRQQALSQQAGDADKDSPPLLSQS